VAYISYGLLGIYYGIFEKVLPILVLHLSLLPLNALRLYQVRELIRKTREVASNEDAVEQLIPLMKNELHRAGSVLFRRGDAADRIRLRKHRNHPAHAQVRLIRRSARTARAAISADGSPRGTMHVR
jgi:hypothetical protein